MNEQTIPEGEHEAMRLTWYLFFNDISNSQFAAMGIETQWMHADNARKSYDEFLSALSTSPRTTPPTRRPHGATAKRNGEANLPPGNKID